MSTESAGEDDNFGTESSQQVYAFYQYLQWVGQNFGVCLRSTVTVSRERVVAKEI